MAINGDLKQHSIVRAVRKIMGLYNVSLIVQMWKLTSKKLT